MTYKKDNLLDLLDPATIKALQSIYGVRLRHIAARINVTPQAVHFQLKFNTLKPWQKAAILDLFEDHGLQVAELILVNTMANKKVKRYEDH